MRWRRLLVPGGLCSVVLLIAATQPLVSQCSSSAQAASVGSVSLPATTAKAMAAVVKYFEGNGFSPNAAAGAAGNSMQESSMKPSNSGGLFANLGTMWQDQVSYDQQHNLDPTSATGQVAYAAFWAKQQSWFHSFNAAKTPQDAALWWQNGYEQCSGAGARGTDQAGGGACNPTHRQQFAAAAAHAAGGSSATAVSLASSTGAGCSTFAGAVNTKGQSDPAPGATWSRLDMGFDGDYNMQKGAVAAFSGTIHYGNISGWPGEGVYFYIINDNQSGPIYTRCMYYAEGATPIPRSGAHVSAGQQIGRPVPHGGSGGPGNFEIGPCQGNGDTLAKSSPNPRAMVLAFYQWMRKLGAGATDNPSRAGFA